MIFIFTKDYITQTRNIKSGTICNILDNKIVIDSSGTWLFDVDSGLARKFGTIMS